MLKDWLVLAERIAVALERMADAAEENARAQQAMSGELKNTGDESREFMRSYADGH